MAQPALRLDAPHRPLAATLGAYFRLTKPRVIELLLVTAVPPMFLAEGGFPPLWLDRSRSSSGGALAAGGANTINCWIERDRDQLMRRTHGRPLPAGRDRSRRTRSCSASCSTCSRSCCSRAIVEPARGGRSRCRRRLFYVFVYTLWLKPRTVQNIVIGGAAGAVPALVGWAAVRNDLACAGVDPVRGRVLLDAGALLGARDEVPRRLRGRRHPDAAGRARRSRPRRARSRATR